MKECIICKENKDLTCFYKKSDGYFRSACKSCRSLSRRESYIKNRDREITYARDYRANNPDKVKEIRKKSNYKRRILKRSKEKIKRREGITNLSNSYILQLIQRQINLPISRVDLIENKHIDELIELKKIKIKIDRKLKTINENETSK